MKTIKYITCFFLCIFFACTLLAQEGKPQLNTVKGQIVNEETGKPVPYATIGFAQLPIYVDILHVTIADEQGWFEYKLPPGMYVLHLSSIGYKNAMLFNKDISKPLVDLGKIKLSTQTEQLATVVVEPMVKITSSEITYNLKQDPDREKMNLHEILDKVPMIDMTPDGKLYIDNPSKTFLIVRNGKKDVLFNNNGMINQTLRTLPAKAFEKVTIKLMPESRYGNYTYVLSIDSDKSNRLFGAINANEDNYDVENGSLALESAMLASYDKLRLSAGGTFKNTNSPHSKQTLEQYFHEDLSQLIQHGKTHQNGESFGGAAAFSYDLSAKHFVTSVFSYTNSRSRHYEELYIHRQNTAQTTDYDSWNINRNRGYQVNGSINYQYDFSKPKRVLNVVYDFSHQSGKQDNDFSLDGDYSPDLIPPYLLGNSLTRVHTLQAHYSEPLHAKWTLENGASYIFRDYRTENKYKNTQREEIRSMYDQMKSSKHLANAYLNLRYQSNLFSGQLKLKGEYLDDGRGTQFVRGTDSPEYISQKGFSLTPEVYGTYSFPKKWIRSINLSYSWHKSRPSLMMMTTRIDYSNPNMLTTGNPQLEDEDMHHVGIGFQIHKGPNINLSGNYSDNRIAPFWYTDAQNRVIRTYANNGLYKNITLGTNYTFLIKQLWFHLMWSESYAYSRTMNSQRTEILTSFFTLQTSIPIGKVGSISLVASYHDRHSSGMENSQTRPFGFRIGTNWTFFKKRLEVEATITEVSNFRNKYQQNIHMPTFDQYQITRTNAIPFIISARWTIGNFQVKPVRKARQGAIIDDIIQAE